MIESKDQLLKDYHDKNISFKTLAQHYCDDLKEQSSLQYCQDICIAFQNGELDIPKILAFFITRVTSRLELIIDLCIRKGDFIDDIIKHYADLLFPDEDYFDYRAIEFTD